MYIVWFTVEELDNIRKIHTIGQDYVPIGFHKRQRQEQNEVGRSNVLCGPNDFPHGKRVSVDQFPLEVQQEPAIAEVEMGVIASGLHEIVHFRIEYLRQWSEFESIMVNNALE